MFRKRKLLWLNFLTNKKTKKSRWWKSKIIMILFILSIIFILIPWLIWFAWFYKNIIQKLPPIEKINDINLSQKSIITDRNWKTLYELFEENRTYVEFDKISDNMKNAIIAIEDKNFWTNPWIDISWIIRAWIDDITNNSKKQWWSTLTQQLIKNLLLTKDKTIERKLKEIVLAIKLNNHIKTQLNQKYKKLSSSEIDKKVKEKILEMYLNYIFLWNNSYWIEAASQTYFWTSSQNLNILQSSILASIPKAPSKFNPYTNKDDLIWKLKIENLSWESINLSWDLKNIILGNINEKIKWTTFTFKKKSEEFIAFIRWLLSFEIKNNWEIYKIKYTPWRKDFVLWRMFEDNFITQEQLKETFIWWFNIKFNQKKVEIKAPHFVFYVTELLKQQYWEELLKKWWLQIKTTLDLNIQEIAENSIAENIESMIKKWANNEAFIYLDSLNWDILSYAWSRDYYNQDIDGQVDMIQSLRQPWSTIKPILYSLWFIKNKLTLDTPIYDVPLTIWWDTPDNVDWNFLWLLPLKKALAYSRNIPAIKMYFAVWEDKEFIKFLNSIGIKSISYSDKYTYWYPIAIWSAELKIIELANAYMHLSALWNPAEINPILEIRSSDGTILYKKKTKQQNNIIPAWVAYILWKALSENSNLPPSWVPNYKFDWLKIATKSWTTNVKLKNWQKFPRDWWLVWYTPSKVAVFWAWNTKWEHLHADAFWWWLNAPTWKYFFKELLNRWYIENEDMIPKEITDIYISKINGKIPTSDTPDNQIISSIWYINNLPDQYDLTKKIEVDKICNWLSNEDTPSEDRVPWYILDLSSFIPNNLDQNSIKKYRSKIVWSWNSYLIEEPTNTCTERSIIKEKWKINIEILKPTNWQEITKNLSIWYKISSPFNIKSLKLLLDWVDIKEYPYNKNEIIDIKNLTIPDLVWSSTLKFIATDEKWFQDSQEIKVNIIESDKTPPSLIQEKTNINKLENWKYKIDLIFEDTNSQVKWWTILKWWIVVKEFKWNILSMEIDDNTWLSYEIYDIYNNKWIWEINF